MVGKFIKWVRDLYLDDVDMEANFKYPVVWLSEGVRLKYVVRCVVGIIPEWAVGQVINDEIVIHPKHINDERLFRHELIHVLQYRKTGTFKYLVKYFYNYVSWDLFTEEGRKEIYKRIPSEIAAHAADNDWESFLAHARKMYPNLKLEWF